MVTKLAMLGQSFTFDHCFPCRNPFFVEYALGTELSREECASAYQLLAREVLNNYIFITKFGSMPQHFANGPSEHFSPYEIQRFFSKISIFTRYLVKLCKLIINWLPK
jgi:hypothetical protein